MIAEIVKYFAERKKKQKKDNEFVNYKYHFKKFRDS